MARSYRSHQHLRPHLETGLQDYEHCQESFKAKGKPKMSERWLLNPGHRHQIDFYLAPRFPPFSPKEEKHEKPDLSAANTSQGQVGQHVLRDGALTLANASGDDETLVLLPGFAESTTWINAMSHRSTEMTAETPFKIKIKQHVKNAKQCENSLKLSNPCFDPAHYKLPWQRMGPPRTSPESALVPRPPRPQPPWPAAPSSRHPSPPHEATPRQLHLAAARPLVFGKSEEAS